jgi:basic membrane lipoprotein Med (substrate-binding protein (PBP1-ABC) superfamily)
MMKNGWVVSVLLAAVISVSAGGRAFGADMNMQSAGGHDASMPNEDPAIFIKNIDKAAQDVLNQIKAGRTMDAQKSAGQLTGSVEKVLPHLTDAGLKDKLKDAANEIKNSVNSGQADIFDLEDQIQALRDITKQVTARLQNMQ